VFAFGHTLALNRLSETDRSFHNSAPAVWMRTET
jgi:hypothetical protein